MPRDAAKMFTLSGSARVTAAEGSDKLPSFDGVAYTGDVMQPGGWFGSIICDLDGFKIPSQHRPILRQHDDLKIVGHSASVTAGDDGVKVSGVFSNPDSEHAKEVVRLAKNGFQWQLSIGAEPLRTEFLEAGKTATVNGREVHGPLTISRETELKEISFVPLGADGNTSVAVSASRGGASVKKIYRARLKKALTAGLFKAGKYSADDVEKMSEDEAKAALQKCMDDDTDTTAEDDKKADAADGDGDEEKKKEDEKTDAKADAKAAAKAFIAEQRKLIAAENKRIGTIQATLKGHGDLLGRAVEEGWSEDRAELEATKADLARLRASRPGAGTGGPLVYVTNRPELNEAVLEAACFHAFRHSYQLENESFYSQPTPDGRGQMARVPEYLKRETLGAIKARYTDQVQQGAHTLFKGRVTLHEVLDRAFEAAGIGGRQDWKGEHGIKAAMASWDAADKGFRAEGASTISISNVLANVMNKFALQGYLFTEQVWREVFGVRPVNDFKPTKSVGLLGDVMYKVIGPTGEIESASLGDQAFANQAQPLARMLTIPWTHIVNDDLGILSTAPQKMGQGAGLAINDTAWTLWKNMIAGTVNGDDGVSFWRTTSSVTAAAKKTGTAYQPNKLAGAGSAFGDAGLKAGKAAFDNQIDPNGNPLGFDGLTPILLHGPTLWRDVTAQMMAPTIVYGGASAALAPNANVWAGQVKPVMSRYVENAAYGNTATGWWLLFNPAALPVVEVAFLNGVDTPAVLQAGPDYQFDKLGISVRGTIAFGVSQQNFRGGVYNAGA